MSFFSVSSSNEKNNIEKTNNHNLNVKFITNFFLVSFYLIRIVAGCVVGVFVLAILIFICMKCKPHRAVSSHPEAIDTGQPSESPPPDYATVTETIVQTVSVSTVPNVQPQFNSNFLDPEFILPPSYGDTVRMNMQLP